MTRAPLALRGVALGRFRAYPGIGVNVVDALFPGREGDVVGTEVKLSGRPFEIIGVVSEKGAAGGFGNPDEQILIPLRTAQYRVMGSKRLRTFSIQVKDSVPIEQGMVDLERVLRREHHIRPGADNDFTIRNQQDVLQTQQQATQVFTSLLASVAAVSLVVGGIGIMNIMLVSVTERTTKAISYQHRGGATKLDFAGCASQSKVFVGQEESQQGLHFCKMRLLRSGRGEPLLEA